MTRDPSGPAPTEPATPTPGRSTDLDPTALNRVLLDTAPDAIITIDAASVLLTVNTAAERLFGYSADELVGRSLTSLMPEQLHARHYQGVARYLETGKRRIPWQGVRVPVLTKGGKEIPVEISFGEFVSNGQHVFSGFLRDVSERVADEQALQQANDALEERNARLSEQALELARANERLEAQERLATTARAEAEEANQAKSAFLATMSHELRTPLNAIGGYAELLELGIRGPITAEQREDLARIKRSQAHLLGLVNDVLDLSKIEAEGTHLATRESMTGPAVRAALDLVRPQAHGKGVALVDARPHDDGISYIGDENRVRQVVVNIVSNAVKFTPPGGMVTVNCEMATERPPAMDRLDGPGPWATIRVTDTGVGIPPEEQGRIFQPFHQVDRGHTREQGGTGLGLSISRRLARLMAGDITVESTEGAGSTFVLWLPAPDPAAAAQHAERASVGGAWATESARTLGDQARGLRELGAELRTVIDAVLESFTSRMRADPAFGHARNLTTPQIEDHQGSFLADLAQSLVIVADGGEVAAELLRDGSAIHRVIAERHGARRCAQGWTEAMLEVEQRIFREEVLRALDTAIGAATAPRSGLAVLHGLMDRVDRLACDALRVAAEAEGRA